MSKTRVIFLSLTIVALLAFSAVGTIPVYADDGTTTESTDTTTTAGTDPVDTSATGDVQPEDVSTPILEQLPENTTVTVIGETGEALPLASQASADAVLLSDPIWCPENQAPTPGEYGCTESYTSFTELLDFLKANEDNLEYQKDGTIYVQQGDYLTDETSIDFNSYEFANQKNLTVQGGWNTTDNTLAGTSNFIVPIIIGSSSNPWGGSLTINNIIIDGVEDQAGLTLYSQGDIELSNVEVTNSMDGAVVDASGNVTVKKSKFNKNGSGTIVDANGTDIAINEDATGAGINITSRKGTVTLQDVEASGNQFSGANITAEQTVTVTNSFFNGNISYAPPQGDGWVHYGYGLQVSTTQNIVLNDVDASGNQLFGASLDGASTAITGGTFNENGSLFTNDPTGFGLKVKSSENVTLQDVEANGNELFGANIDADGSVVIRNSFFNGNQSFYWWGDKTYFGYGLQVTTPADIGLIDVTANDNNLLGAHLEGSDVIINTGSFSNNGSGTGMDLVGAGLEVVGTQDPNFGRGDVSLFNIIADNNKLFGADINTTGYVAISADEGQVSSFSGHTAYVPQYDAPLGGVSNKNGGYGLKIVAPAGNIDLQRVVATGNFLYGASLEGVNITISDGVFSSNGSGVVTHPTGFGLKIHSTGLVALKDVEANNNQLYGADIWAARNVDIGASQDSFSYFTGNQSVSFDPCSGLTFYGYGLTVYSEKGDITLNHVEANYNNLWGGSLDGLNVFVLNSKFNNNVSDSNIFIDDTGLIVNGREEFVIIENTEAKDNRLIGATITAVGDVYISGSTFTGNAGITCSISWCPPGSEIYWGYGLNVVTPGLISLDGVNASNNSLFGAHLEGSTVNVSNSSFNNNGNGVAESPTGRGLEVISGGTVTINLIEANGNQLFGANIDAKGDVTVTASDFIGNYHIVGTTPVGYGLQVVTLGNITLNSDNDGYGIQGYQNGSGAVLQGNNVTVIDSNFYDNATGNGLTITAAGAVILTNVTATSNGQNGVDVTTPACAVVQVNGGTFSNNGQYGLSVNGGIINLDGTQTFVNNGVGNVFHNPAACAIVFSIASVLTETNNVITSTENTTTIGATDTGNKPTTVTSNKKTAKKAKVHKVIKKRHPRRGR
jgi:hypothetical protein